MVLSPTNCGELYLFASVGSACGYLIRLLEPSTPSLRIIFRLAEVPGPASSGTTPELTRLSGLNLIL
jgi:hypothetical protein